VRLARLRGTVRRQRHDSEGPARFRKISKWVDVTTRAVGVPIENTPCSGALPSHIVPLRVIGPSSGRVHSASLPHERLTAAWGSEIRTASGMPDDRSPRVFHIPDAQRRDCSLAFAVLRGCRCALPPQSSLWESAALSLLGFATSVVSLKSSPFPGWSAHEPPMGSAEHESGHPRPDANIEGRCEVTLRSSSTWHPDCNYLAQSSRLSLEADMSSKLANPTAHDIIGEPRHRDPVLVIQSEYSLSPKGHGGSTKVVRLAGRRHGFRRPGQKCINPPQYWWIFKYLACDDRRVSVRLLFVNEHGEIDRVELAASGIKVYGRPGHPLKLDLGEVNGPPPVAQCRIRQMDQLWVVENTGAGGQTLLNGEPVNRRAELGSWDEIRCGSQMFRFENGIVTTQGQTTDSVSLRGQLDELNKTLAATAQRATLSETVKKQLTTKLQEADEQIRKQSESAEQCRRELSNLQRRCDELRASTEELERHHATERAKMLDSNRQLGEELERAKRHIVQLERSRSSAESGFNEVSGKLHEAGAVVLNLKQQVQDATGQSAKAKALQENLTQANKRLTEDNEGLARVAEAKERSLQEARASRAQVEKEIRELRDLCDKLREGQQERDALHIQAARARRALVECQAKLRRYEAEAEAVKSKPQINESTLSITTQHRQAIKALDRAIIDANYSVANCEEKWSRSIEELSKPQQRQELIRELRQASTMISNVCACLDQLHRLLPRN